MKFRANKRSEGLMTTNHTAALAFVQVMIKIQLLQNIINARD